jgi:hypothetical protein
MLFDREVLEDLILMLGCISLCIGLIHSDLMLSVIEIKDRIFYDK